MMKQCVLLLPTGDIPLAGWEPKFADGADCQRNGVETDHELAR
jgi:hypothetical protein